MRHYRRYNENTVSSTSETWTRKNSTLKNQHTTAILHTPGYTYKHKCAYIHTKGKQGLVHIFPFICSISVFLFCSFVCYSIMFVAFSTVLYFALTCYTELYIFYCFLFLVCFLILISICLFGKPVCHVPALLCFSF